MKNYLIILELRKNFGKFEDDSKIGSLDSRRETVVEFI